MFEVILLKKKIDKESWEMLLRKISKYMGYKSTFHIYVLCDNPYIKFYIDIKRHIPSSLDKLDVFLFKEVTKIKFDYLDKRKKLLISSDIFIKIKEEIEIRKMENVKFIDIRIKSLFGKLKYKMYLVTDKNNYHIIMNNPANLLTVDFNTLSNLRISSTPKYLDISKCLSLLTDRKEFSFLEVDTFPFIDGKFYLKHDSYDFNKHSLVVGSSGSGKSKFLASFVKNIVSNNFKYKVVIIDPHAAMENDIGGLGIVVDFITNWIDLFASDTDIIVNIELLLELIMSLIGTNNKKVERVLRHSIYVLLVSSSFNFINLKNVILDIEYRSDLINKYKKELPPSIIEFFASEFNEIKTKSYMDAISPIISLVDELSLIPVFNEIKKCESLKDVIKSTNVLLFSLDRCKLGDKITKTLSGLIMQQLLTLVQKHQIDEHIIFIVDEVPVIENNILSVFLSEARKYNLSLILAGQYLNQVSEGLKNAIFANVLNYYIFRVSREDASLINKSIGIKIPLSDDLESKIKLLAEQKNRECIVRISKNGILLPPLKGYTTDFVSVPRKNNSSDDERIDDKKNIENRKINKFNIESSVTLRDILKSSSTSRKDLNNER